MLVRALPQDATAEDSAALLEDIEKELNVKASITKEQEELK